MLHPTSSQNSRNQRASYHDPKCSAAQRFSSCHAFHFGRHESGRMCVRVICRLRRLSCPIRQTPAILVLCSEKSDSALAATGIHLSSTLFSLRQCLGLCVWLDNRGHDFARTAHLHCLLPSKNGSKRITYVPQSGTCQQANKPEID